MSDRPNTVNKCSYVIHGPAKLQWKDREGRQHELNIKAGYCYAMALKAVVMGGLK